MIRFRFREDEKRYIALVSDVYRLVATNLPAAQVSTVMRSLGKLQDLLMLEGIRQGVAAAAISNIAKAQREGDKEELKAFQLHAHVYGSQDTPLRDIEEEWLEKFNAKSMANAPWLDSQPMRFAPETEREFQGSLKRTTSKQAWKDWDDEDVEAELRPWDDLTSVPTIDDVADLIDVVDEYSDDSDDLDIDAIESSADGDTQEKPQLLDQIREVLMDLGKSGLRPRDWQSLILRLHLALHVDAGAIDIQLGTAMGQTVLAQTGFHDVRPGPFGTNLQAVYDEAQSVIGLEGQQVEIPIPAVAPQDGDSLPEDE